ncbi:MAG: VanZ family protein [Magnetococcus sp. MYC-9]
MNTKNNTRILWLLPLLAYSVMIYFLSSGPVKMPGSGFPGMDKWLHASAYALMAALAWQALRQWPLRCLSCWAWFYTVVYGATDEWHQHFVPGRHADIWDWVADVTGASLFILIRYGMSHWQQRI